MIARRRKILVISVAVLAVLSFTGFEYLEEPPPWHPAPFWGNYYVGGAYTLPLAKTSNYSFSESGNTVKIGYLMFPFIGVRVLDMRGYYGGMIVLNSEYWIQSLNMSFPYTAVSLVADSFSLTVNGSLLTNVTGVNGHNIIPYLDVAQGFGSNRHPTLYVFRCEILNNDQKLFSSYFNSGNYTFNFTAVFTPVFEIGPYWVKGTPQQINYQWYMTIIT